MRTRFLKFFVIAFTFAAVATMAIAAEQGGQQQPSSPMGGCCGGGMGGQ